MELLNIIGSILFIAFLLAIPVSIFITVTEKIGERLKDNFKNRNPLLVSDFKNSKEEYEYIIKKNPIIERYLLESEYCVEKFNNNLHIDEFRAIKKIYMNSEKFNKKRLEVYKKYDYRCNVCGSEKNLQIHHKNYLNIFQEPIEDLELLCAECHTKRHEEKGYPRKMRDYFFMDFS
jgi:uncharacterized protein (DUF1697 family)